MLEGFHLHPDTKDTPEHVAAVAAWELRRQPNAEEDKPLSTCENKILRDRLGLSGYITQTITLIEPVAVLGCRAEKVVFARQINGTDGDYLILLHLQLVDGNGKRSIVSSRKKVPDLEWLAISDTLATMRILWRERDPKRRLAA